MSKKKKKLKFYKSGSKKKNSGKKAKSAYKKPKYRDIKATLNKKEAKANKKTVLSPVEVPKDFKKNRIKCNHAGDLISVEAYKAMTPNYAAYTPMLDRMVERYGAEHVRVCQSCYDVVVDRTKIRAKDVIDAMTTLYASVNAAVANRRMKDDEVKSLAKLKDSLDDFNPVVEIIAKLAEDEDKDTDAASGSGRNLNNNLGGAFIK